MYGRQQATPKFGIDVCQNFADDLKDVAVIDKPTVVNGRFITMVLAPIKKQKNIRSGRYAKNEK